MESPQKGKRQLQAEQTKDRLFTAAVELLGEKDFADITIRDIVSRAQVSIGTFYNYYTTKTEVFYETYRVADEYFSETVAPTLSQGPVYDRLLAYFDAYAYYSSVLTEMKMTKLLYNTENPFFNRDPHQGMVGLLVYLLQEGLDTGVLAGGDTAEEVAGYLMISIRGLVYNWCTRDGAYDLTTAVRWCVVRLLKGYLPDNQ